MWWEDERVYDVVAKVIPPLFARFADQPAPIAVTSCRDSIAVTP